MKDPISIKEIFAVIVKHGRGILCVAVIAAILGGGARISKQLNQADRIESSQEEIDQRYEEAMEAYRASEELLKRSQANTEKALQGQREYNTQSIFMQINPYQVHRGEIVLALSGLEEPAAQQEPGQTPENTAMNRILDQYCLSWRNLPLDALADQDVNIDYVREVVSVQKSQNGSLVITADAPTEAEAELYVQAVYQSLLKIKPTVEQASYAHDLVLLAESTGVVSDQELAKKQQENMNMVLVYTEQLETYETELDALSMPGKESGASVGAAIKSGVKGGIVAGVVGLMLACVVVWLRYIVKESFGSSRQTEAVLAVPFLGNAAGKSSIWGRMSGKLLGERQWKDPEQAMTYIRENIRQTLPAGEKIALVSTLKLRQEQTEPLAQMLRELGFDVTVVDGVEENPAAAAAFASCTRVLLAERMEVSHRPAVLSVLEQARRSGKPVLGFVLI